MSLSTSFLKHLSCSAVVLCILSSVPAWGMEDVKDDNAFVSAKAASQPAAAEEPFSAEDRRVLSTLPQELQDIAGDREALLHRVSQIHLSRNSSHESMYHARFNSNTLKTLSPRRLLGVVLLGVCEEMRQDANEDTLGHSKDLVQKTKNIHEAACHFDDPQALIIKMDFMLRGRWGYQKDPNQSRDLTLSYANKGHHWARKRVVDGYSNGTNGFDKNPDMVVLSVTEFAEAGDVGYFKMMINSLLYGGMYFDRDQKGAYRRLLNRSTLYPNVPENNEIRQFVRECNIPCHLRARHTFWSVGTAIVNFLDRG